MPLIQSRRHIAVEKQLRAWSKFCFASCTHYRTIWLRTGNSRIPMTRLADRLIDEALARPAIDHAEFTARVAEERQSVSVPG